MHGHDDVYTNIFTCDSNLIILYNYIGIFVFLQADAPLASDQRLYLRQLNE